MGVLEGVRVLDFVPCIAGSYCATLPAEFGSEVVRVEKCGASEDRFLAPSVNAAKVRCFCRSTATGNWRMPSQRCQRQCS
jgi:crotonobetainyl-CoA:carnitine CoA-transferase CaiB-like acyl-CoA transferase